MLFCILFIFSSHSFICATWQFAGFWSGGRLTAAFTNFCLGPYYSIVSCLAVIVVIIITALDLLCMPSFESIKESLWQAFSLMRAADFLDLFILIVILIFGRLLSYLLNKMLGPYLNLKALILLNFSASLWGRLNNIKKRRAPNRNVSGPEKRGREKLERECWNLSRLLTSLISILELLENLSLALENLGHLLKRFLENIKHLLNNLKPQRAPNNCDKQDSSNKRNKRQSSNKRNKR